MLQTSSVDPECRKNKTPKTSNHPLDNKNNKQYKRGKHYRKQIKQIQEICHFNFI
jgi:hypothetical protein